MLDHVGFAASDYSRSKQFYDKALAPLGLTLVVEPSGQAAGFGVGERPFLWVGRRASRYTGDSISLYRPPAASKLTPSMRPRLPPAARTTVVQACVRCITPITTEPTSWIPMATTSKPSVIRRRSKRNRASSLSPTRPRDRCYCSAGASEQSTSVSGPATDATGRS